AHNAEQIQSLIRDLEDTYTPAYGSLARANLRSVEEGLFARRLIIAWLLSPEDQAALARLERATADKSADADAELAVARRLITQEIEDPTSLENKLELTRLDTRLEFLQRRHQEYDATLSALETSVAKGDAAEQKRLLAELDRQRDSINEEVETARTEMRLMLEGAISLAAAKQRDAVDVGLVMLALALALGAVAAAAITINLVRPLRR